MSFPLLVSCRRFAFSSLLLVIRAGRADAKELETHRAATLLTCTNVGALRSPAHRSSIARHTLEIPSTLDRFLS